MELDYILVSSEGGMPYILVASAYANDLWHWLGKQHVVCTIPTDAVYVEDEASDATIEIDRDHKAMEPVIDKWFEQLNVKSIKSTGDDNIVWEFEPGPYAMAVRQMRKGFLKPGSKK